LHLGGGDETTSWRHEHIKTRLLTFIFRIMTREEKIKAIYKEMADTDIDE